MKISRSSFAKAALLAVLAAPGTAYASGYEFDGIGARAVARGGAVIADSPDWTAIYWNPANLTEVTSREAGLELKAGKSYMRDGNSFSLKDPNYPADVFGKKKIDSAFFFGSVGAVVPLDSESALGAGFFVPLMQGSKFKDTSSTNAQYNSIDYDGFASIIVGNVSYARKVSKKVSVALGINAMRGNIDSDTKLGANLLGGTIVKKLEGSGYNIEEVVGANYHYSDVLSFGAVFRTGSKVKLKGEADASAPIFGAEKSDFEFTLRQPPTSGIGAAWVYRKNLVFTCDFTQTWWRGFSNETKYDTQGTLLTNTGNTFNWRNSYKFRAGALWTYSDNTDLMAGYAYDTPAMDAGSLDLSTAIDVPMHRLSAALSHRWDSIEGTLGGLLGYNSRNAGGVNYRLGGWYLISEIRYKF